MSLLFLLIIVVAEVNNVSATVVRAQHARKGPNVVARRAATNEKANNRAVKTNAQRQRETRQEKDNDKKTQNVIKIDYDEDENPQTYDVKEDDDRQRIQGATKYSQLRSHAHQRLLQADTAM